jgi:cysteinyl-tRNA synthetase
LDGITIPFLPYLNIPALSLLLYIKQRTGMEHRLQLYNSMSRKQEIFIPLNPPFAGMYVCGPTVYSDTHLCHARPFITFDILYRWLMHLGYKVRYVRNITDVGHLENEETDSGEDKITLRARQEQIEPMEVVQKYMNSFHISMAQLNTLNPSIEPRASGHIVEQQEMIRKILAEGFAYEVNGSVYFDVIKYNENHGYGKLSGRVLDELKSNSRNDLEGSNEKRSPFDFALWKKASPEHIMKWPSEWSEGFPGWHLECSAMSTKYLGEQFDIHGGGMDLKFPHHECEIAQSTVAMGHEPVRYWVHNNMITIGGQKMARSLGNFITLDQLFTGKHLLLSQPFSPMTIRFFILQAHYRSTLDFSDEALQAAGKGLKKLMAAAEVAANLKPAEKSSVNMEALRNSCYEAMNDDLSTPKVISVLFEAAAIANGVVAGNVALNSCDLEILNSLFKVFLTEVLGLASEEKVSGVDTLEPRLIEYIIGLRQEAKENKDWKKSDSIRDDLSKMGIKLKDRKDGADWEIEAN